MNKPHVAQRTPYALELEAGSYWWCSCGLSKNQPFCDGSHQGSSFAPVEFSLTEKTKVWLCGCKQTHKQPHCDGTHSSIT